MLADIRHVARQRPRERELHAAIPLVGGRQLRVVLEDDHERRALRGQAAAAQALELRVAHGGRRGERRVADLREDRVAVRPIEEQPEAAAQHEALRAGNVVRRAEPRRVADRRPLVVVFRDAVAGLHDAVERIAGVGHELADGQRGVRTEQLPGDRIPRLTVGAGTGAGPDAPGHVERGRGARRPPLGEEVRRLQVLVVLRPLIHEAQAVVERQLRAHLPVVLHVPVDLIVEEAAFHELRLLLVAGEHAEHRVGEPESACRAGWRCRWRS